MVRPQTQDPALCEELKKSLAELHASRVERPAAVEPADANTLAPDPTTISENADLEAEIARVEAALRENGCVE